MGVIVWFYVCSRLSAFACVCLRSGRPVREPEIFVCLRLFAFVGVCQTPPPPPLYTPPLRLPHPDNENRFLASNTKILQGILGGNQEEILDSCKLQRNIKRRPLQKSEGNFSERVPGWIWPWIFLWIFSGLFSWRNRRKKSTQKFTAIFKSEFGSFGAQIHTARIRPWKLQQNP